MKKLLIILLMYVIGLGAKGQVSQEAFRQWHGDKYSMFIHFGRLLTIRRGMAG